MEDGNWQNWATAAVVIFTALAFVWRHFRKRTKAGASGCGHDCGCGSKSLAPKVSRNHRPGK